MVVSLPFLSENSHTAQFMAPVRMRESLPSARKNQSVVGPSDAFADRTTSPHTERVRCSTPFSAGSMRTAAVPSGSERTGRSGVSCNSAITAGPAAPRLPGRGIRLSAPARNNMNTKMNTAIRTSPENVHFDLGELYFMDMWTPLYFLPCGFVYAEGMRSGRMTRLIRIRRASVT